MDPLINRQLGNYRLDKKLGAGACGVVYKAEHLKLGTPFAIKILHPVLGSSKESSERFLREARTAARIGHENVVFIADFDVEPGIGPYFVMEYLDGESLRQSLDRESPFHAEKVAVLCEQICHALAAAHRLGVVHRDLKPDNIMIVPRPSRQLVKILDFGIAKITLPEEAERIDLTQSGHILGTPRYFSPEQAQGQEIDHRSDIYSFGVILYEMLTGQTPFQGRNPEEMRHHHIYSPPPPLGSSFPNELQDLLDWLLSKHVDERPDDMEEVWSLLKEALPLIKRVALPREEIRETQRLPGLQNILAPPSPAISRTSGYQENQAMAAVREIESRSNHTIALGMSEHDLPDAGAYPPEPTAPHIRVQEQDILDEEHTLHESMLPPNHRTANSDEEHEGPTIFDPSARLRKLLLASTQPVDGTDEIALPNAGDEEEGPTMVARLQDQDDEEGATVIAPHQKKHTTPPFRPASEDIGVEIHASALDAEDTAMHPTAAQRFSDLPSASDDDLPTAIARPSDIHEHTMQSYRPESYAKTEATPNHPPNPTTHSTPSTRQAHTLERRAPLVVSSFPNQDTRANQDTREEPSTHPTSPHTPPTSPTPSHLPHPSTPPSQPKSNAVMDALLHEDALLLNEKSWQHGWFQRWQALDPLPRFSMLAGTILLLLLFGWMILGFLTPPPPRSCEILLKTSPSHAEIWLDNKMLGRTPYTLRRPCQTRLALTFRKNQYTPHKQDVRLHEESSEMDLPLRPLATAPNEYTLLLDSIPSDAAVHTEDGAFVCRTPCPLKAPLGSTRSYTVKKRLRRRRSQPWFSKRITLQFVPPQKTHTLRLR